MEWMGYCFFHGGGFVIESAFSALYTKHLNLIVFEVNVIAVSVNYRLAPEHPLPIAYEDSWFSVKWICGDSDEWIRDFADMDRVYFGGDSDGGNIAHNMAMRFGLEKLDGFNLRGMYLNSPFFWVETRVGDEAEFDKWSYSFRPEDLWCYVYPGSSGCDEPLLDPGMDLRISSLGAKKVLVYVGRKDFLKDRSWYYKEVLEKSGWDGEVEIVDVEAEDHIFDLLNPTGENTIAMFKKVAGFLNQ